MYSKRHAILNCLFKISKKYNKLYCYPCQVKILELLNRYYNIKICRRQLNYYLKDLESQGYIKRIRRIKRDKSGRLLPLSTLYLLTRKALSFLGKAYNTFKQLLRKAFSPSGQAWRIVKSAVEIQENEPPLPKEENLRRLRELISSL